MRSRLTMGGTLAWCAACLMLGIAVGITTVRVTQAQPTLQVLNATEISRVQVTGGMLVVSFDFLRRSTCNTQSMAWLWREEKDPVHGQRPYFVPLGGSSVTLAEPSPLVQQMKIARPLPRGLTSGEWFLRYKYLDSCGWFPALQRPTLRQSPDIPIYLSDDDLRGIK